MGSRIRFGFDVGSGATKVCCEHKDLTTGIATVVFEQEVVLLLGQRTREFSESREDHDGSLVMPDGLADTLEDTILLLLEHGIGGCLPHFKGGARHLMDDLVSGRCVVQAVATATAIFRLASNGQSVLDRLTRNVGLSCQLLPQEREAELGYLTAVSVQSGGNQPAPSGPLVSWDSGGASFQLATPQADGSTNPLRIFNGLWGNSVTHLDLLQLQQTYPDAKAPTHIGDDPNPVGVDMALRLHKHILDDLNNDSRHPTDATRLFREIFADPSAVRLHGIGGPTSAFKMTALATGKYKGITCEDVWRRVEQFALMTSQQIGDMCYEDLPNPPAGCDPENEAFSQPKVLVPKLVLVFTVMKHLQIASFDFSETIGNTRAIVAMEDLWTRPEVDAQASIAPLSALRVQAIKAASRLV